jgi:FKBP-type peptidyl-prolyl cis-trans isomerase
MKEIIAILLVFSLAACTEGVEKKKAQVKTAKKTNVLDLDHQVVEKSKLENGLIIEWFKKGTGPLVKFGDLVKIDFKVRLKDGTEVDGNHLLNRKALPFMVGFGQQTPGWDNAFLQLHEGDFARILIPSPLARGVEGIEGLIPPNADNILVVRVLEIMKPDKVIDGTKVWLVEENTSNRLKFNEKTEIVFHGMASSPSSPVYVNTFRSNTPLTYRLSDKGLVPGLRKALINSKKADRLFALVPASQAYKQDGYLDYVKPGDPIFYNIFVLDVMKIK